MGQKTVIELNGKQYDAASGTLLGESRIKATPESRAKAGLQRQHGRAIDGFFKAGTSAQLAPIVKAKPAPAAAPVSSKPAAGKHFDIQRNVSPQHTVQAHQVQKSQTLMRHVVKKPIVEMKPSLKTTVPTEMMAKPASELTKPLEKKLLVSQVDPIRLARSKHVAKSHHIRRYNEARPAATVAPARAVLAAPTATTGHTRPATVQYATRPIRGDIQKAPAAANLTPAVQQAVTAAPAATQNDPARQKVNDMFEAALAHAAAHEEPLHRSQGKRAVRRRRLASVLAGLGAFLVIGGFVAYLNIPGIEVQFASVKAGFHAQLPGYKPAGYALNGGVKSDTGRVAMTFSSGDSSYQVVQEASDWDSQTLLDQNGKPDKTVQSNGRTIYIYGTTATWVNGGIRYQISGGNLDQSELVNVATSM